MGENDLYGYGTERYGERLYSNLPSKFPIKERLRRWVIDKINGWLRTSYYEY